MASNLSEEEARALASALSNRGGASREASVAARQFDQPLRLSAADLAALRDKLRKHLRDAERELAGPLRSIVKLDIVEVAEVSAATLPASLEPPFAALRFEVDRQPGWLVWDCKSAVDAVEVALGSATPGENKARRFSPVELSTCTRLLSGATQRLATSLGLKAENFSLAQDHEHLGNWRQGGEKAEPQRLAVQVSVSALGAESVWRLLLPGVGPAQRAGARSQPPAALPAHLGEVTVELRARLGGARVPLSDLLAIEPGDVIPLDRDVGEALELCVEDQACMRAALGASRGKLAVLIQDVKRPKAGA